MHYGSRLCKCLGLRCIESLGPNDLRASCGTVTRQKAPTTPMMRFMRPSFAAVQRHGSRTSRLHTHLDTDQHACTADGGNSDHILGWLRTCHFGKGGPPIPFEIGHRTKYPEGPSRMVRAGGACPQCGIPLGVLSSSLANPLEPGINLPTGILLPLSRCAVAHN